MIKTSFSEELGLRLPVIQAPMATLEREALAALGQAAALLKEPARA